MTDKNNIFEDLARVTTNIASTAFESAKSVQDGVKAKTQSMAKDADLVSRDEFEVLKSMASRIRMENEELIKTVAELKKQLQLVSSNMDLLKEKVKAPVVNAQPPKVDFKDDIKKNVKESLDKELGEISKNIDDKISKMDKEISNNNNQISKIASKIESIDTAAKDSKKEVRQNKEIEKEEENKDQSNLF